MSQATGRPTLDQVIDELMAERGDVALSGEEYVRDGRPFAARPAAGTVELRLGAEIAEAARRTPDTGASSRGGEWVSFSPGEWDQHSSDRLRAWFRVAWRSAGRND